MKLKNVLLTTLSFVLVAAVAIGGTLAYLTSTDSDVNVMTLGNVEIVQHEQQLADDGVTLEPFEQAKGIYPGTDVSKIVTVENTGESDVYFRTLIAFEDLPNSETFGMDFPIGEFSGYTWSWGAPAATIVIDGVTYQVYEARYNKVLKPGETSPASLTKVEFATTCTNEDMEALGDTYDILVLSQAVQAKGFANAQTALDEGFGKVADKAAEWFDGIEVPTVVSSADELATAIANGGEVILSKDITGFDANNTISVATGKNVTLNLNGHKLSATANKTGNQELFLVKGNMTVKNGTLELTAENNQAWNAMATIFDVTAGGVLNMEGITANVGGTDMNFIVHLNNWGEATLNVNNCDFTASYVAVRAFNSGYDMNNVTIKNTDFHTGRMFWVHNYTSEGKDDSTLNLDIYGNNNTTDNEKPVRFGFSDSVYYDINGNQL